MKKITSDLLLVFLIFSIVIISGCKKDGDNDSAIDIEELLTTTGWTNQSISYTEDGVDATQDYIDFFGIITATFSADGTYNIVGADYGVITSGTWVISADHTTLTATDITTDDVFVLTIVSITPTALHLTFTYTYDGVFGNFTVFIDGYFIPAEV